MDRSKPFLLVRARPRPEQAEEFERWFRQVHLADVRRIPGIDGIEVGRTSGGAWLGIYSFPDADAVQAALASPEAAYARGTWQRWAEHLEELQIEIYTVVVPLTLHALPN